MPPGTKEEDVMVGCRYIDGMWVSDRVWSSGRIISSFRNWPKARQYFLTAGNLHKQIFIDYSGRLRKIEFFLDFVMVSACLSSKLSRTRKAYGAKGNKWKLIWSEEGCFPSMMMKMNVCWIIRHPQAMAITSVISLLWHFNPRFCLQDTITMSKTVSIKDFIIASMYSNICIHAQ